MRARRLLLPLLAIAIAGCSGGSKAPDSEATINGPTSTPSTSAKALPTTNSWRLSVKILKKTCNGSAGCNVSYRIVPSFVGTASTVSLLMTYEVLGGKDGPQVNTFDTDEEGNVEVKQEETLTTATSTVNLTARVTAVKRD